MNKLAIWLPTYKRPGKLAVVAKNVEEATKNTFTLYFGVEPDDVDSIEAALATGHRVIVNKYEPGYSNTIQTIYEITEEPFWFHANDDFRFLPDWDEAPLSMFKRKDLMVAGMKQREEDTSYSAICMARKKYIDTMSGVIDMPKRVFFPYHHNYIDTEFTQTAQARGVWAPCEKLCIIHEHPGFTGGEKDETYKKNDATAGLDQQIFESRKHLWENL